jgi:L-malate glycosyltransferase
MKVLLVGAGNSIHLQRWANGLVQAGCDVACATVHAPLPQGWDARVALHLLRPQGGAGYVLAALALRRLASGCALVHAHYATGYGFMAALALVGAKQPLLVSVWGSDVVEFPHRSPVHAALLRWVLRRASALAATSQSLVRGVQALLGQPVQVYVTPFGVDTEVFVPPAPCATNTQPCVIGSSKSLAGTYGIDVLLRAFATLPTHAPDGRPLQLCLLASGPQEAEYRAMADALGLHSRVAFMGGVLHAAMPQALQRFDVFVAPSRQESFGVSALEASACALPVVASHVGGLPEVVRHGVTGLLVPPGDVPALAAALLQLVQDPALGRNMGGAGRRWVLEQFAWPASVRTMLAVYRQVLQNAAVKSDRL